MYLFSSGSSIFLRGRSLKWPLQLLTTYSCFLSVSSEDAAAAEAAELRYCSILRALDGDSTTTSVPPPAAFSAFTAIDCTLVPFFFAAGEDDEEFIEFDDDPIDAGGHGTSVADTIAGMNGIAPGADIIALKVCAGQGGCPGLSIAMGIEWAVKNSVDILNLSLGSDYGKWGWLAGCGHCTYMFFRMPKLT